MQEDRMDLVTQSQMSGTSGVGKNVSVAVYLGNGILTSAKKILSYRHPVVHKIEPNHAPGSGDNMTVVRISVSEIGEIGVSTKTILLVLTRSIKL